MFSVLFLCIFAIPFQTFASDIPEADNSSPVTININDLQILEFPNSNVKNFPQQKAPAPGLSSVTIADYGYLSNGNFGVTVQVMGYGNPQMTTFNGKFCKLVSEQYITNGSNVIIGWFHTYDCGPVYQAGKYNFNTTYKNVVSPYNTITRTATFIFE